MKQTILQIPLDVDKLDAIRQFTPSDKPSLEDDLLSLVEKIYSKTVPEPVRRFIENRSPEPDLQPAIRRKDRSTAHEKVRGGDSGDALDDRGSGG